MDETVLGKERGGREEARRKEDESFHGCLHLRKYRQFPGKVLYL
jgi:hypothetical protein